MFVGIALPLSGERGFWVIQLVKSESSSNAGGNGIGAPFGLQERKKAPRAGSLCLVGSVRRRGLRPGISQQKTRRGVAAGRSSSVSISQLT
jgi:hypothetical protein